ncbi:MAG TPA: hypothetical protein VHB21_07760, partial [Minicystis sp.]|nr:hypothetical protein [Minicystis sp.]
MRMRGSLVASPVVFAIACGAPAAAPPAAAPVAVAASAPSALAPGCDAPAYHRLDFWIGAWDVTAPSGTYEGTNVIERALGGCAVAEHWIDARGHRGESLFYVDRATGAWRQLWVTDEGASKDKREVPAATRGDVAFEGARDRTTLSPIEAGKVRQTIVSLDGRASWTGVYA